VALLERLDNAPIKNFDASDEQAVLKRQIDPAKMRKSTQSRSYSAVMKNEIEDSTLTGTLERMVCAKILLANAGLLRITLSSNAKDCFHKPHLRHTYLGRVLN
jgi:hypothetical protein